MLTLSMHLFYERLVNESLKCSTVMPTQNYKINFSKGSHMDLIILQKDAESYLLIRRYFLSFY